MRGFAGLSFPRGTEYETPGTLVRRGLALAEGELPASKEIGMSGMSIDQE